MIARILTITVIAAAALLVYSYASGSGYRGTPQARGQIHPQPLPAAVTAITQQQLQAAAARIGGSSDPQILFGDLHVRTTWSNDVYFASLPLAGGEGSHPPRRRLRLCTLLLCAGIWSINDHAVSLNQHRWNEVKDSIRQCNAVSDPQTPDVAAFLGYEWTQSDPANASQHFGHKNVIFRHRDEARVAKRPIYARTELGPASFNPPLFNRMLLQFQDWRERKLYQDWNLYMAKMENQPECPDNISSAQLPDDCKEGARAPGELFRKLDEAGHDAMVIPHGNTWGLYTPASVS